MDRILDDERELGEGIERRVALDFIRYGNCWEDADVLCAALQVGPGKRVLSICSAGDNVLALLAEGAAVVAADLNPTQLACLELRCAAFRSLEYNAVLQFLGVRPDPHRLATYRRLAPQLTEFARSYWDSQLPQVAVGIIHAGKLEAYFRRFRQWVLPLIHSKRSIADLLRPKSLADRATFWHTRWNNRRWEILFRLFFSRRTMGRLGRDPEFFRYVEGSVADRVLQRTRYALTELPTHENPYLHYVATGNFGNCLPRYLRPEQFDQIRAGLDRLVWQLGPIERVGLAHVEGGYDAMNLSDIFEYLDTNVAEELYGRLLELASPQARLAYWNTFVPRARPPQFADRVETLTQLANEMFRSDKAFFYHAFHIDHVRS